MIVCVATLLLLAAEAPAKAPAKAWRVPVATLASLSGDVAIAEANDWKPATRGQRLRTGDRLRTGAGAMAHVSFPWTSLRVSSDSVVSIPPSPILAVSVERGRVEQDAEGAQTVRLETPEAVVRGEGRVILRRSGEGTAVTVVSGGFRVEGRIAGQEPVELHSGEASLVTPGHGPAPAVSAPPKPGGLLPGADPLYVVTGDRVSLQWTALARWHHLQVLAIDSNDMLLDRDLDSTPPYTFDLPELGTYRWRVAAGGAGGIEGLPSEEGLICVVEK